MKKIIFTVIGLTLLGLATQAQQDSIKILKKGSTTSIKIDSNGVSIIVGKTDSTKTKKIVEPTKYPRLSFNLDIEHLDIGFSKYHTGSDFSTPDGYGFLENQPGKTSTFGFDFLEMGLRFNPNIKVALVAGLDWNHIRLEQNVTIRENSPILAADPSTVNFEKNRLSSRYLRIPLYFEYRTSQNKKGDRATIIFGPEVGFLLNGKVKQVSDANGKVKIKDDYNFEPFRYGANFRIAYGGTGLFFKYFMNDVFAQNQGPADYKNLNFGLTFGF